MGNAGSRRSSTPKSRRYSSREQLRAKSFLKKEQHAAGITHAEDHYKQGGPPLTSRHGEKPHEEEQVLAVEKLELEIQRLADKCAALESQNILVSVQQLDLLARFLSYLLSFSVLYVYWTFLAWSMERISYETIPLAARTILEEFLRPYCFNESHPALPAIRFVGNHSWTPILFQGTMLLVPYFYNRWTHGSTHRRFQVFVIAFIVIGRIRMCRWRENTFVQEASDGGNVTRFGESCTNDGIWEANYEISARFLYLSIMRLRGLWTKTAQYLSSRADFVPVGYIRELSKLQDQAPATPWEEVQKLLSPKLLRQLTDIDQTPLASASIGQVHAARLKSTGEKVVIKVQHPHARTLMTDDFWSLKVLTRIIGWLEPDYAFMEILMNEWASEARKELDFKFEAEHLRDAESALQTMYPNKDSVVFTNGEETTPFQVEIPEPIEELSNRNVLVMSFCEGCRVDDFRQVDDWGLSRNAIMDGIAQAFAHYMYCCSIFNGDPHPGNLLVRPGIHKNDKKGFTLVLLDWGLAKRLPEQKRLAFAQMVYAAATFDYGLLLDSYKTVGLKMKREDAGQSMEDMRFFLRDMAPREVVRKKIKSKMRAMEEQNKITKERVPMESKAYPGEFFFFVRVNELLHGLGSRFSVNLGYLDSLKPYAERGLRMSKMYDLVEPSATSIKQELHSEDDKLQEKLETIFDNLQKDNALIGGQVCVLDKHGRTQADVVAGNLGGLRSHIPMQRDALILGYSTTKAVTATLAHIMVQEGYLSYDEPISERVWKAFCPTARPPGSLASDLDLPDDKVEKLWQWKREITLRHILNHTAGLWSGFPARLTIKKMASCEECFTAFEYNPAAPDETVLPTGRPGEKSEYHFMSFGWLVAGTLCGAYGLKLGKTGATYEEVYKALLEPKLSEETRKAGFRPLGGAGCHVLAQTATSDIRASKIMQQKREADVMGEADGEQGGLSKSSSSASEMMKTFQGIEFLLDPRIWNSQDALEANVPAAGGRFSAVALAHFYHDIGSGRLLQEEVLSAVSNDNSMETSVSELQGVTHITNDGANNPIKLSLGYQLIRTERDGDDTFSGLGHAGVGGSIAFLHKPTGIAIGLMLNKADGDQEVTMRILRVIGNHLNI